MPTLNWIGKQAVENHDKEIPYKLIKCEETVGDKDTGNLIVQGDNLEALKALLPYYAGQVKCIYIDPPYNTGNEGWAYNDNVNSPEIREWLHKVVGKEGEDLSRHDKWLCMMYPRLKLLKRFLREDGVVFISIDDNEIANLILVMDEVFVSSNFITNIIVKMSHLSGVKMSHVDKKLPKLKEYVIMYAKNKTKMVINAAYSVTDWKKAFDRYKSYLIRDEKEPDNLDKWRVITLREAMKESGVNFNEQNSVDKFYLENAHNIFRTARNRAEQFMNLPRDEKFRIIITPTGLKKIAYKREEVLFASLKLNKSEDNNLPVEPLGDIWTDIGINNLHNEGGVEFRNGKKPLKLLRRLIEMGSNKNDLILDSFAGSGSTAEATVQLNNLSTNRKYIIIEMEQDIASEKTYKRMFNVVHGYEVSKTNGTKEKVEGLGGGFKYCKLGEPLFDEFGNIRKNVKFNDLAHHVFFSETGTPLPPFVQRGDKSNGKAGAFIGEFKGVAYYLLFNGILGDKSINGGNVLTSKVLDKLPKYNGKKIIFGEGCRLGAQRLRKENITFKQIPYEIRIS